VLLPAYVCTHSRVHMRSDSRKHLGRGQGVYVRMCALLHVPDATQHCFMGDLPNQLVRLVRQGLPLIK
jgi:hypothetical protein